MNVNLVFLSFIFLCLGLFASAQESDTTRVKRTAIDTTQSEIFKIWEDAKSAHDAQLAQDTLLAQDAQSAQDTTKTSISSAGPKEEFKLDTIIRTEESPLDIASDRGLYITTDDGIMQLRILGSIRYSALYDFVDMPLKHTFNTYYISTGDDNVKIPNYYNSLNLTRLGFEVTRKLKDTKVFIRLETDFNGPDGQFRIRHAYGQIGNFLVGQTWSLFSNVSVMPVTVDGKSATGSVKLRHPQIRYRGNERNGTSWSVALEYSQPELNPQEVDTIGLTTVQMIPDFTARFQRVGLFGEVQLSAIATLISTSDESSDISNMLGYGLSLSGVFDVFPEHNILYQLTGGRAISHYISTFSGTGTDAVFNPETNEFAPLNSFGGFLSYGFNIKDDITACTTFGAAWQVNKSYQPDNAYRNSISLSFDTFWEIIEGARIGLEYAYGQRWDKDSTTGQASRIWALFYYDF